MPLTDWHYTSLKCAPPLTLLHMHSPCCRSGWAPTHSQAGCRSCCSPGPRPSERRACTPDRPATLRSWGTALRCTASSFLRTAVARGGEGKWEMPGLPEEDFCKSPAWFKVSWTGASCPRCCRGAKPSKCLLYMLILKWIFATGWNLLNTCPAEWGEKKKRKQEMSFTLMFADIV